MHINTKNFISNKLIRIKADPTKLLTLLKKALSSLDLLAWKKNYMPAKEELLKIIGGEKEKKKTIKEEMREKAGLSNDKETDSKMYCTGGKKMYSTGKQKKEYKCKYCGQSFDDEQVLKKHQSLCSLK